MKFFSMKSSSAIAFGSPGGGSSGADLVETVSLSFGDIEIEYKPQDAKGNLTGGVKSGWNIKDTKTR